MNKTPSSHAALYLGIGVLFFLILTPFGSVSAQEDPQQHEACVELGKLDNFSVVDNIRGRLQTELATLNARKKSIMEFDKPQADKAQTDLQATIEKIEPLKSKSNRTPDEEAQLKDLVSFRVSLESFLRDKSPEALDKELKQIDDDVSWKDQQQKCVMAKLQEYSATPQQDFKRTMSIIFSILIGLVIAGFFTMAWIDETVRRAIFSGQTGLQFVTLFSIVIAIILFGITTILEGKELAALLGGLSGYILGRISSPTGAPAGGREGSDLTISQIRIAPGSVNLSAANASARIKATALDKSGNAISKTSNEDLQWASDNPAVATVDNSGTVQRVGAGSCNITATSGGVTSNPCVVTSV